MTSSSDLVFEYAKIQDDIVYVVFGGKLYGETYNTLVAKRNEIELKLLGKPNPEGRKLDASN